MEYLLENAVMGGNPVGARGSGIVQQLSAMQNWNQWYLIAVLCFHIWNGRQSKDHNVCLVDAMFAVIVKYIWMQVELQLSII